MVRATPWEHPKGALRAAVRWGRQVITINSLSNSYNSYTFLFAVSDCFFLLLSFYFILVVAYQL